MNDLLEFLNTEESKKIMEGLTVAERIKYATAFQWAGVKPTPEEAAVKAKQKCSGEDISKRHDEGNYSFESELAAIDAMKEISGLTDEETERLDENIFSASFIDGDLQEKIVMAFHEKGTEDAIIDALCSIHSNWMRNHGNNFQKSGRDKDYQFVDLRLMSFGDDGATADLIFLRPILEACKNNDLGIEINMEKLEQRFHERQVEFLRENNITSKDKLCEYLAKGAESNEALEGLIAGDGTGRTIDEILRSNPEVVNHMGEQVVSKLSKDARFDPSLITPKSIAGDGDVMKASAEFDEEARDDNAEKIEDDFEKK